MGHNRKNANRGAAITRLAGSNENNRKAIAALRTEYRKNKTTRDRELLDLERRVLGELEIAVVLVHELAAEFELHRRPWYRKAIEWIRQTLRLDPELPEALPEPVDPSEEETDPDIKATIDEIAEAVGDDQADEPDTFDEAGAITGVAGAAQVEAEAEAKKALRDRMYNPEKILERLECRLDAERGKAADIMENQELDQEAKSELMDRSLEQIEEFEGRIAHQKLVVAGLVVVDELDELAGEEE